MAQSQGVKNQMRAIITLQNSDGSYDAVGMNNRTVFDRRTVVDINEAALYWSRGKPHRIDYYYSGNLLQKFPNMRKYKCGAT